MLGAEEEYGWQTMMEVEDEGGWNRFWVRDKNFFRGQGAPGADRAEQLSLPRELRSWQRKFELV